MNIFAVRLDESGNKPVTVSVFHFHIIFHRVRRMEFTFNALVKNINVNLMSILRKMHF